MKATFASLPILEIDFFAPWAIPVLSDISCLSSWQKKPHLVASLHHYLRQWRHAMAPVALAAFSPAAVQGALAMDSPELLAAFLSCTFGLKSSLLFVAESCLLRLHFYFYLIFASYALSLISWLQSLFSISSASTILWSSSRSCSLSL